jgi:hypothetical protein
MKKIWQYIIAMGRPMAILVISLVAISLLLTFRLGSLTPGLSENEVSTFKSSQSLATILENPVNAPYKLALYSVTRVTTNIFAIRIISVAIGGLAIVLFYFIARRFLSIYIAYGTTLLFATSSLLLHTSRLAVPDISWLVLLALFGLGWLIRFDKHKLFVWLLTCLVIGLALYIPGMVIFIVLGAIWQYRRVRTSFDQLPPLAVAACALFISIISLPLIMSLIRSPSLWQQYIGVSNGLPGFVDGIKSIGEVVYGLFVLSPADPERWLGRQPILDIFTTAMFIYGAVTLAKNYKLDRLWVIGSIFLVGLIWIAITAEYHGVLLLLPFIYILIGIGIGRLSKEWFEVFPRNPIARWIGVLLILSAMALSANFQARRYFIAWAHNSATKSVFQNKIQ